MFNRYNSFRYNNQDRFISGGFIAPFILGGITGGLIANNRPNSYYNYPVYIPYYQQYPYPQFNNYYY